MNDQVKPETKKTVNPLFANNMGIAPTGTIWDISSEKIEDCITRWFEHKGLDTANLTVRCVLTNRCGNNRMMAKAAAQTNLPFLVILFRNLADDDFTKEGGIDNSVRKNIARMLNNFQDSAQFRVKDNAKLNQVLQTLLPNPNGHVEWELQKRNQVAYTVIDSDIAMALCFSIPLKDLQNWTVDFLTQKPRTRKNPVTGREEFIYRVAVSKVPPKGKPKIDPVNFIR